MTAIAIRFACSVPALLALLFVTAFAQTARAQNALSFNGTDAHVSFGDPNELHLATFTVETWFRRDGTGTAASTGGGGIASLIPLVTKGTGEAEGTNKDANYILGINTIGDVIAADFEEGAGGASPGLNHPISGVTAISNGVWYHAAVTYDGTTFSLYLNGILENSLVVGQPPRSDSIQHAALATSITSTGLALGFFDGVLDEGRIWNFARSAAQIRADLNSELTSATGLVARWGLNEGSGTLVGDSTSPASNSTVFNNASWVTGAPFDIALCDPNESALGPCDDGIFCNGNDTCTASLRCDTHAGEIDGTGCNDGDACTTMDMCLSGACVGDPMTCGNGTLETSCGEECDPPEDSACPGGCQAGLCICTLTLCGNGNLDPGEDCDDGNVTPGDCCSDTCSLETGGCDDGDPCTINDQCQLGTCQGSLSCGDGTVQPGCGEDCEDDGACVVEGETCNACVCSFSTKDHYQCYKAKEFKGVCQDDLTAKCKTDAACQTLCLQKFASTNVSLTDQFGSSSPEVKKPKSLCAPVEKNPQGPPPPNPALHYKRYQIKGGPSVKGMRVLARDQFGDHVIELIKGDSLLVPAAKDLNNPVEPPAPGANHYLCYKAKNKKKICSDDLTTKCKTDVDCTGGGICDFGFGKVSQELTDQFGNSTVEIKKVKFFCTPVDKDGSGIADPSNHLIGYQIKGLGINATVHTNNQFGPEALALSKQEILFVPAEKNPAP